MMFETERRIELRDADLGVTARWDGGVTAVLVDKVGAVIGRIAVGDAPSRADVDGALLSVIRRESDRRRASIARARGPARPCSPALGGAGRALLDRGLRLGWSWFRRGWTDLEPPAARSA